MKVKEESEKVGLKFNIQKPKIMASSPIISWQIDGETMEIVGDFIFLDSKITANGDCSHEIKRCLLLGRKAMTTLDNILKSRGFLWITKYTPIIQDIPRVLGSMPRKDKDQIWLKPHPQPLSMMLGFPQIPFPFHFNNFLEWIMGVRKPLNHFSHVWLFVTPWTVAHQAPLSMGFSRQEY